MLKMSVFLQTAFAAQTLFAVGLALKLQLTGEVK
jgi:hypothetical protein